jgi:hypothetical protein
MIVQAPSDSPRLARALLSAGFSKRPRTLPAHLKVGNKSMTKKITNPVKTVRILKIIFKIMMI